MRWKSHKGGDIRIIKRFAIFPISIGYESRWLEIVTIKQQFSELCNPYAGSIWVNIKFIDKK